MKENEAKARLERRAAELDEEDRAGADSRATVTLQQDSVGRLSRMDAMQQQAPENLWGAGAGPPPPGRAGPDRCGARPAGGGRVGVLPRLR